MIINIFAEGISDSRLLAQLCVILQHESKIKSDYVIKVYDKENVFIFDYNKPEGGKCKNEDNYESEIRIYNIGGWLKIKGKGSDIYINYIKRYKSLIVFDADEDPVKRRNDILAWKEKYGIDFELFLFPNDKDSGAVETLLETIINPQNQCVIDCWHKYEDLLSQQTISWKAPNTPTCPSEKSKIYGYLEALVDKNKSDLIKDPNRVFTIKDHWNLNASGIQPLRDFLIANLK